MILPAKRVYLPVRQCIYVIPDIHGRADLLAKMLLLIQKNAASHRHFGFHRIVTLGDYIDRRKDAKGVIDLLIHTRLPGFIKYHMKGNHEAMLLNFLHAPEEGALWFRNGGRETLASYGVTLLTGDTLSDWVAMRDEFLQCLPKAHLLFFHSLRLYYQLGGYFFVHAGVKPGVALSRQREEDLLWIRQEFLNATESFGKVVVHGHSIVKMPEVKPNRIALDTGAYDTGRLVCLVLLKRDRYFLETVA